MQTPIGCYIHTHIIHSDECKRKKRYFIRNRRWSERSTYCWDTLNILKWWPEVYMCWCAHDGVCVCLPVIVCVSVCAWCSFDDDGDDNDDDLRNTEALLPFVVIVYFVCVYLNCVCECMVNGEVPISFCHVGIVSFWTANPSNKFRAHQHFLAMLISSWWWWNLIDRNCPPYQMNI